MNQYVELLPVAEVFAQDHWRHVETGEGNEERRVEQADIGPHAVVDDPPS